ncbi:MAG: hypothetical protein AVDCRST_MAG11-3442, partial [uncultured Gemmatimonadaceae bacterium]
CSILTRERSTPGWTGRCRPRSASRSSGTRRGARRARRWWRRRAGCSPPRRGSSARSTAWPPHPGPSRRR